MHDMFQRYPPEDCEGRDRHESRSFELNDPLFDNLVRCIAQQCLQFIERHGGAIEEYFVGMSHDVSSTLRVTHHMPAGGTFMVRDGLDRFTARAVIQRLVQRGCKGDDRMDERDPIDLYMFRLLPGITEDHA